MTGACNRPEPEETINSNLMQLIALTCACGCGQLITPDDRGRPRRYIHGHNSIGTKQSLEWVAKKSAGMKRAWADPQKMKGTRNPSFEVNEKRAAKLRGRKLSPERCAEISKSLTGRKLSETHRLAVIKSLVLVPDLSPEAEARRRHSISVQRTGTHGYGRTARDNLNHSKALHWIVRDPFGRIFEFNNADSWARKHENLFLPDDRPESRLPLCRRFISGLHGMQRTDRKGQHSWKGWTLVSVTECEVSGAPDLLGRMPSTL